jgi:hypothetical protein
VRREPSPAGRAPGISTARCAMRTMMIAWGLILAGGIVIFSIIGLVHG